MAVEGHGDAEQVELATEDGGCKIRSTNGGKAHFPSSCRILYVSPSSNNLVCVGTPSLFQPRVA